LQLAAMEGRVAELAAAHQALSVQLQATLGKLSDCRAVPARPTAPPIRPPISSGPAVASMRRPSKTPAQQAKPAGPKPARSGAKLPGASHGSRGHTNSKTGRGLPRPLTSGRGKAASKPSPPTAPARPKQAASRPARKAKPVLPTPNPDRSRPEPPEAQVSPHAAETAEQPAPPSQLEKWSNLETPPQSPDAGPTSQPNQPPWPESTEEAWWRRPLSGWKSLFGDEEK
jgi:hypothetical protein